MSKFSDRAESFTGTVSSTEGKHVVVQAEDQSRTFTVEGDVNDDLSPGHEVTMVTWDNASALRVVNHTTNTIFRPYYNPDPENGKDLPEAYRSSADTPEGRMGLVTLLSAVALATIYQSIPIYGWYVSYRMILDPDKSVSGTAPQYEKQAKTYFLLFFVLAFVMSGYLFMASGDIFKAGIMYMTVLYIGTFMLMRRVFLGIEEIDIYTHSKIVSD